MATMSITAGGGEVNDLTAAPGSSCACDICGATDELKEWLSDNSGVLYYYCKVCWFDVRDSAEELEAFRAQSADEYENCCTDGLSAHRCEDCDQSDDEPETKRQALECNDCKKKPATVTFTHLDGRNFNLCSYCWQLADHEEDYGAEFGSVPRLRVNGPITFCECPLPCDFISPTRCELCKGVVVVLCNE